jgi:putative endonuclease
VLKAKKTKTTKPWLVYILRCKDKSFYTGITNDLEKRLAAHREGNGAKYTRSRRPVKLMATTGLMSRSDAARLEIKIKTLPKEKKVAYLEANHHPAHRQRAAKQTSHKRK